MLNDGESDNTAELLKGNSVSVRAEIWDSRAKITCCWLPSWPYHPCGWAWFLVHTLFQKLEACLEHPLTLLAAMPDLGRLCY
jgi:hypothetical protein